MHENATLSTIGPGWELAVQCPHCGKIVVRAPEHLIMTKGNITLGELARRSRCQDSRCRDKPRGGAIRISQVVWPCSSLYAFRKYNREHDIFIWRPNAPPPSVAFKELGLDARENGSHLSQPGPLAGASA